MIPSKEEILNWEEIYDSFCDLYYDIDDTKALEDRFKKSIYKAMQEYAELWHSQQPGISAERAQYLLNIRDALVHSDVNEAFHWLSKFYNPTLDKYSDEVWKDMEELAATEDHEKYIHDTKSPTPEPIKEDKTKEERLTAEIDEITEDLNKRLKVYYPKKENLTWKVSLTEETSEEHKNEYVKPKSTESELTIALGKLLSHYPWQDEYFKAAKEVLDKYKK